MITLSINDEIWEKIFKEIRAELVNDSEFLSDCQYWDPSYVIETYLLRHGIRLIRKLSRRTHNWDEIWLAVEIDNENIYTELVLKYL